MITELDEWGPPTAATVTMICLRKSFPGLSFRYSFDHPQVDAEYGELREYDVTCAV